MTKCKKTMKPTYRVCMREAPLWKKGTRSQAVPRSNGRPSSDRLSSSFEPMFGSAVIVSETSKIMSRLQRVCEGYETT